MDTRILKDYIVENEIGEGGYGRILKAKNIAENKYYAIKVMPIEGAKDDLIVGRAKKEAAALSELNHSNIVKVKGFLSNPSELYIIMEYITGHDLDTEIEIRKKNTNLPGIDIDLAIDITLNISSALALCHEKGIIHRDIKPANLIFTETTSNIMLIDFGIIKWQPNSDLFVNNAKITNRGLDMTTKKGEIIGTPCYISPEQLKGKEASALSDTYSLAISFYHMIAGTPPFDGEIIIDTLHSILHDKISPPPIGIFNTTNISKRSKIELNQLLHKILLKATNKDPSKRYQDPISFAKALKEFKALKKRKIEMYLKRKRKSSSFKFSLFIFILLVIAICIYIFFR